MRKLSIYREYISCVIISLLVVMFPVSIFGEVDTNGFYDAKWGMSASQVREKFNSLFTSPDVVVRNTQNGDEKDLIAVETKKIFNCTVGSGFDFIFRNDKLYMRSG